MNLNYNIEVSHIARSWYFENRRKIRKVYTRELKNNKKIEEQEPARTIDKHHSAIEVRKKKKTTKNTHWFCVETKKDNWKGTFRFITLLQQNHLK